MKPLLPALLAALVAASAVGQTPALPATPAPIEELLVARPFHLEEPAQFPWDVTQPPERSGWLLVLRADPGLAFPRQVEMPLLQVGGRMALAGHGLGPDGVVVAIVLGPADLAKDPIFFGTPRLPEQARPKDLARELGAARAAGLGPVPSDELARALEAGGAPVAAADLFALGPKLADVIERYAAAAEEPAQ